MKKKSSPPILPIALSLVFVIIFVLGQWQLSRQNKKLSEVQNLVIENSQTSTEIVNFINASLSQAQQK